jgi:hypothetical protein
MSDHVSSKHYAVLALSQAQQQSTTTMALVNQQITKTCKEEINYKLHCQFLYH